MTISQKEIDQQVSKQTGETLRHIRSHGFTILEPNPPIEERQDPLVIDWDLEQQTRNTRNQP